MEFISLHDINQFIVNNNHTQALTNVFESEELKTGQKLNKVQIPTQVRFCLFILMPDIYTNKRLLTVQI